MSEQNEEQLVELSSLSFGGGDASTFPTTREIPCGKIELEIKSFTAVKTKVKTDEKSIAEGKTGGKLMLKCLMAVSQPEEFKGIPHTEMFVIGSDSDKLAKKESTWTANGTNLMNMFKKARVNLKGVSPHEAMLAAAGSVVGAIVREKEESFVNREGQKVTVTKHVIKTFFEAGTQPYAVEGATASPFSVNGHASMQAAPAGASTSD